VAPAGHARLCDLLHFANYPVIKNNSVFISLRRKLPTPTPSLRGDSSSYRFVQAGLKPQTAGLIISDKGTEAENDNNAESLRLVLPYPPRSSASTPSGPEFFRIDGLRAEQTRCARFFRRTICADGHILKGG
jgi:hypothetical protein